MQEETVMFSLDNAKTPKEKRAAYKTVQVQMQKKGKLIDVYCPRGLCERFSMKN